jgi:hypothetical protein
MKGNNTNAAANSNVNKDAKTSLKSSNDIYDRMCKILDISILHKG